MREKDKMGSQEGNSEQMPVRVGYVCISLRALPPIKVYGLKLCRESTIS
jgi:hypothetical protein